MDKKSLIDIFYLPDYFIFILTIYFSQTPHEEVSIKAANKGDFYCPYPPIM